MNLAPKPMTIINRLNKIRIKSIFIFGKVNVFQKVPLKQRVFFGGLFFIALFLTIISFTLKSSKTFENRLNKLSGKKPGSIAEEMVLLDNNSPLDLVLNSEVEQYINLYKGERISDLTTYISRAELYFPIIESYLDKYNLPLELKYIAVVESGLNPLATSKSGAVGLWQFLYNTCDLLSIEVNSYVDRRRDVFISTDAACRYLKYLYSTFNDWQLVLAAYNGGPGEVREAIARSGGETDFWKLRPYLSDQAANYVPAFIAFNYLFKNYSEFNIKPKAPKYTYDNIDTILIGQELSLLAVSKLINIGYDELEFLNPSFKTGVIPQNSPRYFLVLPKNKVATFIRNEDKIYRFKPPKKNYTDLVKNAGTTFGRTCIEHEVKEGEYFHKLALKYNCTVENIKAWNQIDSNALYVGQKIKIWIE